MADNIDVTPGSGKTVRTDDVSGVQVQVVKIALGADGAEDTLVDSGQQLMANSVPVAIASNQGAIPVTDNSTTLSIDDGAGSITVDGTVTANVAAGTALMGKVGIDQATANANEVVVKSGTLTTVSTVTAVTGITNALPAGTNAIGKLAANSGVDIGDADVTSVIPGTGATNLGKAEDAAHTSGDVGVMMLGVRNEGHDDFSGTDKDYIPIALDAAGDQYVVQRGALPAGTNAIGKLAANSGVDIGDVDILSIAAGTNLIGKTQPFSAMIEGGLTELVGINEQVDQNDYSGSVGVSLATNPSSGEILGVAFYATEDGTGAVQDSAGILYVLDADPSIASGDTAMSAAARVTVIGKIAIGAADWDVDANGGLAYVSNLPIPFHSLATLYFAWKHLDATSLNDGAGDDEQLEFNFWYKRES